MKKIFNTLKEKLLSFHEGVKSIADDIDDFIGEKIYLYECGKEAKRIRKLIEDRKEKEGCDY